MFKKEKKKSSDKAKLNLKILNRIWREHTKKYIWALLGAMLLTAMTAGTEAFSVSLLKPIFDNGFIAKDSKILIFLCAQIIGLYFIKGWFYFFQTLILSTISTRTVQSIQQRVFSHLLSLDIAFFNKTSSGQMLSRVITDCSSITNIAINFITTIFKDIITCVAMFALMIYYSWKMCLVIFIFLPVGALAISIIVRKTKNIAKKTTQKSADFVSMLSESFQSVKII